MKRYRAKVQDRHYIDEDYPGYWSNGNILYPVDYVIQNPRVQPTRPRAGVFGPLLKMKGTHELTMEPGTWDMKSRYKYKATRLKFEDTHIDEYAFIQEKYLVPLVTDKKNAYTFWGAGSNAAITIYQNGEFFGVVMPVRANGDEVLCD